MSNTIHLVFQRGQKCIFFVLLKLWSLNQIVVVLLEGLSIHPEFAFIGIDRHYDTSKNRYLKFM